MFQKILLFLILSHHFTGFGQDSTHVSAYLKDAYFVYPYELGHSEEYSNFKFIQNKENKIVPNNKYDSLLNSNTYATEKSCDELKNFIYHVSFDENIAPGIDSLIDGKYIRYYSPFAYSDLDTIKFKRNKIAYIYSVKNNLIDGNAYWFTPEEQKMYNSGKYLNGKKQGEWKMKISFEIKEKIESKKKKIQYKIIKETEVVTCSYNEGEINGILSVLKEKIDVDTLVINETITYENDKRNGAYQYSENNIPLHLGIYSHGEQIGDWYIYERKIKNNLKNNSSINNRTLLVHYKVNELKKPGKSIIIRGNRGVDCSQIRHKNYFQTNIFSPHYIDYGSRYIKDYNQFFYINQNIQENVQSHHNGVFFSSNREDVKLLDSFGYVFDYTEFQSYYPNGQLYTKFKLENGTLENEDTIFWENGNVKDVVIFDSVKKQYIHTKYEENGNKIHSWKYDLNGYLQYKKEDIIYKNRTYVSSYPGFKYTNTTEIPLFDIDSTYLISEQIKGDENNIIEQILYNPLNRISTKFEKIRETNISISTIIKYDSLFNTCIFQEKLDFDQLSISFEVRDSIYIDYRKESSQLVNDSIYKDKITYIGRLESNNIERKILYDGIPFSGKINIYLNEKKESVIKKNNHLFISVKTQLSLWNLIWKLSPNLLEGLSINEKNYYPLKEKELKKAKNFYSIHSMALIMEKGKLMNDVSIKNKNGQILAKIPIKNNTINGTINFYSGYPTYWKDENNSNYHWDFSKQDYYLSEKINYLNGEKSGESFKLNKLGDTTLKSNYLNGERTGNFYSKTDEEITTIQYFDKSSIKKVQSISPKGRFVNEINYKNFRLEGKSFFYNELGKTFKTATFKNGLLNDSVIFYNLDNSIKQILIYKNHVFTKEVNLEYGLITDEFINDTNFVKYTFPDETVDDDDIYDKIHLSYLYNDEFEYKNEKPKDYFNKKGYTKFYNSDGLIYKEGGLKQNIKEGLWQYNYPNTLGKFTINHFDSILKINDSLTFETKGYYTQFDEQGNVLSKRYILSSEMLYNCGQGETYDIETFYVEYEKDTSLHLRNGWMQNYYPTGVKQSEGKNKEGLQTEVWKFYNDNGSLRETGHYVNGKKEGRWLRGDLDKVNYMGDMCFDLDNKKIQEYVKELENQLNISETYYENGKIISDNHFILLK